MHAQTHVPLHGKWLIKLLNIH